MEELDEKGSTLSIPPLDDSSEEAEVIVQEAGEDGHGREVDRKALKTDKTETDSNSEEFLVAAKPRSPGDPLMFM